MSTSTLLKETINNETESILISTFHFESQWFQKFPVKFTQPSPFFYSQSKAILVDTMFQRMTVPFATIDELDCTGISLPYGTGKSSTEESRVELIILLPNSRTGLPYLEQRLDTDSFYNLVIRQFLRKRELFVYLPKFQSTGATVVHGLRRFLQHVSIYIGCRLWLN